MLEILVGGEQTIAPQLVSWLAAWGLRPGPLPPDAHPAEVPAERACAVVYACGPTPAPLPRRSPAAAAVAPLLLIGTTPPEDLRDAAWIRVADPGPEGSTLAGALRPLLATTAARVIGSTDFRDLLSHELRTPLTAAGTALQTLAKQLERSGGPSLEMVDIALRNLRRLERTVDWACDYLTDGSADVVAAPARVGLLDLIADLDALEAPVPLTWSTCNGDWNLSVRLDRNCWNCLLNQVLRAVSYLAPQQPVHLDLSLLPAEAHQPPGGLLLIFNLPDTAACAEGPSPGIADHSDQLQRLLAFTVNPSLVRSLELRLDVMRLSDRVRLRLMLPLAAVESYCVMA
jgi:signal transduction histidine kinase